MDKELSIYQKDIDELYDGLSVEQNTDGTYQCPVCRKQYKQYKSALNHVQKRNCYHLQDIFAGSITEQNAFDIYKEAMSVLSPQRKMVLSGFRKSREYKPALEFALFCMNNRVKSDIYTQWIIQKFRPSIFNYIKTIGQKDETLRQFRDFLIINEQCIDSEYFFEQNQQRLYDDEVFMVRSLERGDIGLRYLIDQFDNFSEHCETLSSPIKNRLEKVMDKAGI